MTDCFFGNCSCAPSQITLDGTVFNLKHIAISVDGMILNDYAKMPCKSLFYPNGFTYQKRVGGGKEIHDMIANPVGLECSICMEVKDQLLNAVCPCKINECSDCFNMKRPKDKNRCLTNSHFGNEYCVVITSPIIYETAVQKINSKMLQKYLKEKELIKMFELYNNQFYDNFVLENNAPFCEVYKILSGVVEEYLDDEDIATGLEYVQQMYCFVDPLPGGKYQPCRFELENFDEDWFEGRMFYFIARHEDTCYNLYSVNIMTDERVTRQIEITMHDNLDEDEFSFNECYLYALLDNEYVAANYPTFEEFEIASAAEDFDFDEIKSHIDNEKIESVACDIFNNNDYDVGAICGAEWVEWVTINDKSYPAVILKQGDAI